MPRYGLCVGNKGGYSVALGLPGQALLRNVLVLGGKPPAEFMNPLPDAATDAKIAAQLVRFIDAVAPAFAGTGGSSNAAGPSTAG